MDFYKYQNKRCEKGLYCNGDYGERDYEDE